MFLTQNLSPALEQVAAGISDRQIWLAWRSGQEIRFLVAEAAQDASSAARSMAIHLLFYDIDGQLQAAGTWALQGDRRWTLCSVDAENTGI